MGYLNNSSIIVDAILTKKGRELLAKGAQYFNITQFALADDEIDYRLWNPDHVLGTNYYGEVIENMPILEAIPDETQVMKYKLVTLKKTTTRMPVITVGQTQITLTAAGQVAVVEPFTPNYESGNQTFGYTAILSDARAAVLRVAAGGEIAATGIPTVPDYAIDNSTQESISVIGRKFEIVAKNQITSDLNATLTIIGNETGGRVTVNITVRKQEVATSLPIVQSTNTTRGF